MGWRKICPGLWEIRPQSKPERKQTLMNEDRASNRFLADALRGLQSVTEQPQRICYRCTERAFYQCAHAECTRHMCYRHTQFDGGKSYCAEHEHAKGNNHDA